MPVRPVTNVFAKGPVKAFRSQDLLTQQVQAIRRLEVTHRVRKSVWKTVGASENDGRGGVVQPFQDGIWRLAASRVLPIALRAVHATLKLIRFIDVDKGIEAFIHPCV